MREGALTFSSSLISSYGQTVSLAFETASSTASSSWNKNVSAMSNKSALSVTSATAGRAATCCFVSSPTFDTPGARIPTVSSTNQSGLSVVSAFKHSARAVSTASGRKKARNMTYPSRFSRS